MMLLSKNLLANESNETPYQIIFSDNTEFTGGPNDIGPTGALEFIYTHPDNYYKISIKSEAFVNGDPIKETTTRTKPDNMRIDSLSMYYIRGETFKYGAGFEILGNMGGKDIQNTLHYITNNPDISAKYSGINKFTPTLNFDYKTKIFNHHMHYFSSGKIPIIFESGILKLDAMLHYTSDNINDWALHTGIGIGVDCTRYPDLPEFKGYPMRDFQVCTPETKLSLVYKNFTFYWEIPLMNNDVQNSFLGLGYQF